MSDKKETVPHVISGGKSGAFDREKPLGVKSAKGMYSGRPHPPARSAASGGDPYGDYSQGAANEGGSGAAKVNETEAVQPVSDSEQVFVPGNAGSPAHRAFNVGTMDGGSPASQQHAPYKKEKK